MRAFVDAPVSNFQNFFVVFIYSVLFFVLAIRTISSFSS